MAREKQGNYKKRSLKENPNALSTEGAVEVNPLSIVKKKANIPTYDSSIGFTKRTLKKTPPWLQGDLWGTLPTTVREGLLKAEVTAEWINRKGESIILTTDQQKLSLCLRKILYHKSRQNTDIKSSDYLLGNAEKNDPLLAPLLQESKIANDPDGPSLLVVDLSELAKDYNGGTRAGGKVGKNLFNAALDLFENASKWITVKKSIDHKQPDGSVREFGLSKSAPLLEIFYLDDNHYTDETKTKKVRETNQKVLIVLHPIWRTEAKEQGVHKIPDNILGMLYKANAELGSKRPGDLNEAVIPLYHWLSLQLNHKHFIQEVNLDEKDNGEEGLLWQTAHTYMKAGKRGEAKKKLEKAVKIMEHISLLKKDKFYTKLGSKGQEKAFFVLNEKFLEQT